MDHVIRIVRKICLGFPEAVEVETWGIPTFRIRNKMFVTAGWDEEAKDPVVRLSMKTAPGEQQALLAEGHPFFYPSYVGSKGWIGVIVDQGTDWTEITELVEESYRETAPKSLVKQLDQG